MKITAIICEYNPMTNGHVKHIELARAETGADTVLCVMSGSFVQRGDAAVADKYIRAGAAVESGADIVVELPVIYAISPADNFAYGAVKTISAFPDVEYLSFGSECGDAELLTKTAKLLFDEPEEFKAILREKLDEGNSFPKARALAADAYAQKNADFADIKGVLDEPNNVLGVAYITAIMKAGLNIKIHTIKRLGGGYNDESLEYGEYISATAVRRAAKRGELEKIKDVVPMQTYAYLLQLKSNETSLSDMVLFKMKSISGYTLEKYYDVSGGIHNRLKLAAAEANTLDELLEAAKTKKYTMARLKRICLYALFDITQEMYEEAVKTPPYVQVLALRRERKDILSALSATCPNVITRYGDTEKVDKSLKFMIKLDFTAQGTLNIINRSNYFNNKMLLI